MTSSGKIDNKSVQKNGCIDGWRVFFELKPDGNAPAELRCFLKGADTLTETVTSGLPNDPFIPD